MEPKGNEKKWQRGDLVLLEATPKTHAMLMEVLEVRGNQAKITYLDCRSQSEPPQGGAAGVRNGGWYPVKALQDPALFLKTEEFLQTLRERSRGR